MRRTQEQDWGMERFAGPLTSLESPRATLAVEDSCKGSRAHVFGFGIRPKR